ncbi:MAG: hypothetical protein ACD_62C00459G0002 [uncultured bacterium]|nr:MAG: hypothetical protein ACD_62C00459G0002 [uncultured bacterium]
MIINMIFFWLRGANSIWGQICLCDYRNEKWGKLNPSTRFARSGQEAERGVNIVPLIHDSRSTIHTLKGTGDPRPKSAIYICGVRVYNFG